MNDQTTQQAEVVEPVKGTTIISFTHPTPMWATIAFRVEFFLNKAIMFWIAGTHLIKDSEKGEIIQILIAVDGFIWGLAKSVGVKPPEDGKQ